MIEDYDQVLATIDCQALAGGVPPDELDDHTAEVLGVPRDHLAAWQLVCGAITTYARASTAPRDNDPSTNPRVTTLAGQLTRLWEHLGAIHEAAPTDPGNPVVVREQSRELIGELFVLTDWLLSDPELRADWPSAGVEVGVCRG